MASVRKFHFDESFDTDLPFRRKAAPPPPEPEPEPEAEPVPPPPPPPPTFSEAEMDQARQAAYAEGEKAGQGTGYGKGFAEGLAKGTRDGHQKGKAEAEARIENRIAAALDKLAANSAGLLDAWESSRAVRSDQPVYLALAIVRKIMPELSRRYGLDEVEGVIRGILSGMLDEPRLIVRVAPDIIEPIRERVEAIAAERSFGARLMVIEEPALGPADCAIEWSDGGAERDINALLAEIEQRAGPFLEAAPL